jgi:AraC family transcriptional regulator
VELSEARGGATVEPHNILYLADVPDPLIRQIAFTMLEELQRPSSAGRVLVETLAMSLVARLGQTCTPEAGYQLRALHVPHALDYVRLRRVLAFIEENLERELSINDLAAIACLSPFHFIRLFRNRMGVPPSRYLSARRLEHSKDLLRSGSLPIAEIALACCFSSQSSFTRAFVRATGVTPGTFRRLGFGSSGLPVDVRHG